MKKILLPFFLQIACLLMFSIVYAQEPAAIKGLPTIIKPAKRETVDEIRLRAKKYPDVRMFDRGEREYPDRDNLPQDPLSKPVASFPELKEKMPAGNTGNSLIESPQTPGLSFNGVTGPTETGAFPPDDMGAIGPTQYIVFVNGRLRSFNKTTGVADGVLNINPDAFFASVITPPLAGEVSFTSDPRIRYDRLSGKWILVIIDVILNSSTGATTRANRILIAYSNASTITGTTVWTFSQFVGEANKFTDYETLGIDANALYIGTNMFSLAGSFTGTNGYVINRSALLSGGAYTVYSFLGMAGNTVGSGPFTPQGVDNFDYTATEGYFIGVNIGNLGSLTMRRVNTPAGVPTLSANINITVSTTASPLRVPHLGNTGGAGGQLDALGDRLFAAVARGGHLWTAHNISVLSTGVAATSGTERRNGVRWYDLKSLTGTPTVNQSGTVFDPLVTASNPRWYSIPSVMVSGQGHTAFSMTTGGNNDRSNAATVGRLSGDALGSTQTPVLTTASSTAYNPTSDPGGSGGRRWGDYSYVSLDPLDDMTMWMIGQYCSGSNVYGCNVTKLIAPPPATAASCSPTAVSYGLSGVDVVVTGTVVSGSGFYDPGANLPSPALAFSHISATVSGGVVVNSVTYTNPTTITLNITTTAASLGNQTITVTNPDGQSVASASGILNIAADATFNYAAASFCKNGTNPVPVFGSGSAAGTFSASPGGLVFVSTATGVINLAASTPGTYTVTNSITTSPTSVKNSIVTIIGAGTWQGTISSNWSMGGNWSCGFAPVATENVIIPSGGTQPVLSGDVTVNDIALAGTISLNGFALTTNGAISGTGTFTGSSASGLIIAGTAGTLNFTPGSSVLKDLTLNTGATATLGTALDIAAGTTPGTVIINSGATLTSGGNLTLKSDDNGTARVGNSAGNISGNVTVERNIKNAGHRAWHLLSTNTTSAQTIFDTWQEGGGPIVANQGTLVTSDLYNGTNGFDMTSVSSSILTHNQGGLSGPSWNYNLSNTNSIVWSSYPGYMLFVRGDRNYTPTLPNPTATNATVLHSTGLLKQGTQAAVTVSATGTGRTLAGNPFASSIDMDAVFTGTANLNQEMYVWDPSLTGNYGVGGFRLVERNGGAYQQTPVVLGGGATPDAASRYIHSGQAFFLKATGSDANVVFAEANKTASLSAINPIVGTAGDEQLFVNLNIVNSGNIESLADGFRVRFDDAYNVNATDDIEKMGNFGENISSYRNNKKWIVEKRPMIVSRDTIFMRMTNTAVKDYRFQIGTFDFVQSDIPAFLEDTYLNSLTGLDLTGTVNNIDFSITSDPASANPDRFRIVFGVSGPLPVSITSVAAAQQGNAIAVTWKVSNQINIQKYEVEKSIDGLNFSRVNSQPATGISNSTATYTWLDMNPVNGDNFYRIRSIGIAGDEKISQIVKVKIGKNNPAITVYPNPVINRSITVQFTDMEKAVYQLRLINATGQVVFIKSINHSGGSTAQTIMLGAGLAKGNYQLEFIKPDETKIIKAIVIAD